MERPGSKYQLIARVGQGGMADVFLAVAHGPLGFDKLVIVKQLRPMLAADVAFREMFIDEARLAGRLNHPNIVQTLEVGELEGAYIIAMEYLEGQPLDVIMTEVRRAALRLRPVLCAQIASDILAGLHHAHEQRDYTGGPLEIVHRDVSPQNVFVTYDGQVKLLDFGVAKARSRIADTNVGTVKGKVSYMAPEQADGAADRRADVFAVGVVLWELCTLERLFPSGLRRPVPPLGDAAPHALSAIIDRATRHERSERYKTAALMREELEAFIASSPDPVRRDELTHLVSTLFHQAREERQARIREHMSGVSSGGPPGWDRLLPLDVPTAIERGASGATGGGALSTDVSRGDGATIRQEASRSQQTAPAPPARSRSARLLFFAAALVAGGVAAALIVPRWQDRARTGPTGATAPVEPEVVLRLCGSYTIGTELAPQLVDAFLRGKGAKSSTRERVGQDWRWTISAAIADRTGPIAVDVRGDGTGTAFERIGAGTCDLGMASRRVREDEVTRLAQAGLGDMRSAANEHVVGLEGIAVIVHPNNSVRALDLRQLSDLFSGAAADWSSVGAPGGPVHTHARDDDSATFEYFSHRVLAGKALAADAKRFPINDSLADAVASDTGAIGFVGLSHVRGARIVAVAEPGGPAVVPSPFTAGTEDYPLTRRLYLYTVDRPANPMTREFLSFALSRDGQAVVEGAGFIGLGIRMRDAEEACHEPCPRRFAQLVKGARRLSLDFRFRAAENDLDSRGLRDVDRVVAFLATLRAQKVLLVGFADGSEASKDKTALSLDRAKKVAQELAARGVHATVTEGFADEMPLSKAGDEIGRERNRRVEIWIRENE